MIFLEYRSITEPLYYREEGKLNDLSSDERLKQRQAVIKPLVGGFFLYPKNIKVSKKDKICDAV